MKNLLSLLITMTIFIPLTMKAQVASNEDKITDTICRTDAFGNKFGYWTEKAGDITFKGEYNTNKKVKNWIGYYSNNLISKIDYYTNGFKDGISIQFDRKGKISVVEHFKNGLTHGQTICYSQYNETPLSETEYAFGKKNGLYRQYYDNAKIQEESWFHDDKKDGTSRWNNKNGQRIAEYNYKAGNFDGMQKTFYENDSLETSTIYVENKLSGEAREYYRNGKLKISGKYLNGEKDGTWTEYNELGKVENNTRFKAGVEIKKK